MIFMAEEEKIAEEQKEEEPKQKKVRAKRKTAKKAEKVVRVRSKRKRCIARGTGKPGTGAIRINGMEMNSLKPAELRATVLASVYLSEITRDVAKGIDISLNVKGGGISAQAQASGSAIAKIITEFAGSDTVRKEYMMFDRHLLIDDARRVEPKKYLGPKARARFQTSYR